MTPYKLPATKQQRARIIRAKARSRRIERMIAAEWARQDAEDMEQGADA